MNSKAERPWEVFRGEGVVLVDDLEHPLDGIEQLFGVDAVLFGGHHNLFDFGLLDRARGQILKPRDVPGATERTAHGFVLMDVGDFLGWIGHTGMLRMARLSADLVALLVPRPVYPLL